MRILIIHPYLCFYGGAETAIVYLSDYLNSKGISNKILTLVVTEDFLRETKDLRLSILAKHRALRYYPLFKASLLERIKRVAEDTLELRSYIGMYKDSYDILNPHNWPANWACAFQGKPTVWMMNEPPDIYSLESLERKPWLKVIRNFLLMTDRLLVKSSIDRICVNSFITYKQASIRYGVTPDLVFFGIDYDFYSKSSKEGLEKIREKYNIHGDEFIVVTCGGLNPQKNQLDSIKTVEIVKNVIPKVKLILVGGGEEKYINKLKAYVKHKKLESQVIFTGHLPKREIPNINHIAHVGLYPFKEQGGLEAPFETLAAGTPIIISETNGASQIVKKYNLGIVTKNYADALIQVYSNYKKYKCIAQQAKDIIRKELSWQKYSERLVKVFEELYNKRKP